MANDLMNDGDSDDIPDVFDPKPQEARPSLHEIGPNAEVDVNKTHDVAKDGDSTIETDHIDERFKDGSLSFEAHTSGARVDDGHGTVSESAARIVSSDRDGLSSREESYVEKGRTADSTDTTRRVDDVATTNDAGTTSTHDESTSSTTPDGTTTSHSEHSEHFAPSGAAAADPFGLSGDGSTSDLSGDAAGHDPSGDVGYDASGDVGYDQSMDLQEQ